VGLIESYRLRLMRRSRLFQARLRRGELALTANRTGLIRPGSILLFSVIRNERVRLPYFLKYYRALGVDHFLIIDNASDDGSRAYLEDQPDVSVWSTSGSYKRAHYGVDWLHCLQWRYGADHWCLTVDSDEFFVYPFCDTRPLRALTDWLDVSSVKSFSAMVLDMYPKGPVGTEPYDEGQDPFQKSGWFDSGNYAITRNRRFGNLWIQGGVRARMMFAGQPETAPALNKIPLVKWQRGYAYVSSTHMILPRGLNLVYDAAGGEKASGCLLHAKFLDTFMPKAEEELARHQHHADSQEYRAYLSTAGVDLWCKWSEKYVNWRQLEILGLMSKGNWA
jgi:Glycosyl transferase family 2